MTQVRSVRRKGSGALRLRLGRCSCAYSLRSQTMQHSVNPARHNLDFKIEPMRVQIAMRKLCVGRGLWRAEEADPMGSLPPHQGSARRVHRDR